MTFLTSLTFLASVTTGVAAAVTGGGVEISADGNAARVTLVGKEADEVNHKGEVGEGRDESRRYSKYWCNAKYYTTKRLYEWHCDQSALDVAQGGPVPEKYQAFVTGTKIDCAKYAKHWADTEYTECIAKMEDSADFAELGGHVDKKQMAKMLFENMESQMEDLAEQMKQTKQLLEV